MKKGLKTVWGRGTEGLGLVAFVFATSLINAGAANYYVSTNGNDGNNGLSPQTPWQTFTNINSHVFAPGDSIQLAGGQIFNGYLLFDSADEGTPSNPVIVTSFGNGRATINSGQRIAVAVTNCAGMVISNLNVVGAGATNGTNDGIRFICELPNDVKLPMISIRDVEVSGFGGAGISIGGWNGRAGYKDVSIVNISSHDNMHSGINIYAKMPDSNTNVYIGWCTAFHNVGDGTAGSGSGVVMGGVIHGTIERCVAYDNGRASQQQGPVGIWTYASRDITVQFNESHHNRSITGYDGGGFDFDHETTASVMQYNYSHDNDGPGLLQCCGSETSNNIVRYNVSENDCRVNWAGAITIFGNITGSQIFNNTIYFTQSALNGLTGALLLYTPTTGLRIQNNIITANSGAALAWIKAGQTNLQMHGNDYWSFDGGFRVFDSEVLYTNFSSWREATGREFLNGYPVGFNVNPRLTGPGTGQTFNDASLLSTLSGYELQPSSPLIDAGLNLPALGQDPGPQDYYGNRLFQGRGYDLGVHEGAGPFQVWIDSFSFPNGYFSFVVHAPTQTTNVIEGSTNLVNWTVLEQTTNASTAWSFTDTNSHSFNQRFYRVRALSQDRSLH